MRSFRDRRLWKRDAYAYAVEWDRLRNYEQLVLGEWRTGALTTTNLDVADGFWNAERELFERRGNVRLIVSRYSPDLYVARNPSFTVQKYQPGADVHLHVKADLHEDAGARAFRITTAHLYTRRVGPLVIGTRGVGRTELCFRTDHDGIVSEGAELMKRLTADELPQSGEYLRLEGPTENAVFPAICGDIRKLRPGTGRILHFRSNYYGFVWKPAGQSLAELVELHTLLQDYTRRGTQTLVGYGDVNPRTLSRLRAYAALGGRVALPRYCPGSFRAPYRVKALLQRIRPLRRFTLSEHFNVTIVDGLRDPQRSSAYSVVYFGHKSDMPYDAGTLELMVRCDSREFPGLAEALSDLVESRITVYPGEAFLALSPPSATTTRTRHVPAA
jgi:hypothetical protein